MRHATFARLKCVYVITSALIKVHQMEFRIQSCVRGFHVYGEHWTAFVGEELTCQLERGNVVDRYAVAVEKASSSLSLFVARLSGL